MNTKTIIFDESELAAVVDEYVHLMRDYQVFTFNGPLGAGKTTLIRAILKKSGVQEHITSPTFTYLNVYENKQGQIFYHFDLYRLSKLDEFLVAGFQDYLYAPNSWTFIEWPAIIEPLLTHNACLSEVDYYVKKRQLTLRF